MTRRHKLLTGLSTLTIASALAFSALAEGEGESAEGEGAAASVADDKDKNKSGEGESEGGSASADPASDDVEYIRRLGLVRGHLAAFAELYEAGETDQALMHAKHPENELYKDLEPAFAARGATGFAGPLEAVASAAAAGGDVEGAFAAVNSEIANHTPDVSIATRLLAISGIVTTAGDEFAIGVKKNGAVKKPHEYQDAYGFLVAAKEILASAEPAPGAEADAVATASEQLDKALGAFSGLNAAKTNGKASTLYGAAARIEIAALGLK